MVKRFVVVDYGGCGWNLLWTLDGETWMAFTRRGSLNRNAIDNLFERYVRENPEAEYRWMATNNLPEEWCNENTRVI